MKKFLNFSSYLAIIAGILMFLGGFWGIVFTYQNVSREKIITPLDASIPNKKVVGPLTLKSQSDVIRKHTLNNTNGKTYAEMPKQIEKLDSNGNILYDQDGKPILIPNENRNIWITATTLTTALHLGIVTYVFSGLIVIFGLISIWTGVILCFLSRKFNNPF